jgi:ABC-2 type transport system permease protein
MKLIHISKRVSLEIFRDPLTLMLGLALPIALLSLFSIIAANAPLDIFKPANLTAGIQVFSFSFLFMFAAMLVSRDRNSGLLDRFYTSPISGLELFAGYLLPFIPLAMIQAAIAYITATFFGLPWSASLFLGLIAHLPMIIGFSAAGLLAGALFTENQIAALGSISISMVSLLGGVWMDIGFIGGIFERMAYALPFAHAVDLQRSILQGTQAGFFEIFVPIVFALLCTLLCSIKFSRRYSFF